MFLLANCVPEFDPVAHYVEVACLFLVAPGLAVWTFIDAFSTKRAPFALRPGWGCATSVETNHCQLR